MRDPAETAVFAVTIAIIDADNSNSSNNSNKLLLLSQEQNELRLALFCERSVRDVCLTANGVLYY